MIKQTTIVAIGSLRVQGNGYSLKRGNFVKIGLAPPLLKRDLKGGKYFRQQILSFRLDIFKEGFGVQESKQEVTISVSSVELAVSLSSVSNRKEGNDQESIQLPNTFRPRHQMERSTH